VTRDITDPNTQLAALRTGQVDIVDGDPSIADAVAAAGLRILVSHARRNYFGFFDHSGAVNPALAHVGVRQALNYAIDRKAITRALFGKIGTPTSSPLPFSGGDDPKYFDYYTYDPAKAKALLAAGYPNGFTLKVLSIQGGIGFKLDVVAQAVCKYLAAVDVKCDLHLVPIGDFGAEYGSGTYDAWSGVSGGDTVWSWYALGLFTHHSQEDQHGWHDPVMDRLWIKASRATPERAHRGFQELLDRAITQAYYLPVCAPNVATYVSRRVAGVRRPVLGSFQLLDWSPAT
jgi:peptide/nickel transport system substrate-binding protein